CTELKLNDY
nr:Chain M, NP44-S7N mutant peptide, CTELKLNDY [H7N9 subtype]4NQX_N Chain N, NP44-S7N mutant peptide, CTELKLNDY [H7N9 subtype]4NQX_O Chain O, NP44-S7N mutant peptide, CTELKLNDY [H7N9 subtype]4NQX_P Chain P, NP44-S7N mutant peptide, CTELKLNDY [H7N9 subtype]4NQX_Q Chain Q, NP44-S7N mutant peptide, CTELKLNDY [H7N9 subtype]4NQX_R Chain R, NP44-S7N mutant peptide, CTELKLNDY [H7N9 subtype]